MSKHDCGTSVAPRRTLQRGRTASIALLMLFLVMQSGCAYLSRKVSERERIHAAETARTQTRRGQCGLGLESLDRAQTRLDLGAYARESTLARTRCYENLGFLRLAQGHQNLIADFYTNESMALPLVTGPSIFQVKNIRSYDYQPTPSGLKIPTPRYSANARRSKIVGRVVVAFELTKSGQPHRIRVLEMPHPLLATWAIEAIARSAVGAGYEAAMLRGDRYATTFLFESRWVKSDDPK